MLLRFSAKVVSVVFHPLIIVTYSLVLLLVVNPYLFGVNHISEGGKILISVFGTTFLLPAVGVGMMKALGLISSLHMPDKQERIGPFILTGIFYLWIFRNFFDNPTIPTAFTACILGATIGLFTAFIINIFFKISIHALGMGGLVGTVLVTTWLFSYDYFAVNLPFLGEMEMSMNLLMMITIFLAGLVGTSRLLLNAHSLKELFWGYAIGVVTQLIAIKFLV